MPSPVELGKLEKLIEAPVIELVKRNVADRLYSADKRAVIVVQRRGNRPQTDILASL